MEMSFYMGLIVQEPYGVVTYGESKDSVWEHLR